MKIQPLKIGTKTAKVPVIQGGMGVGISLGNLAGAVAKEGGIGIISAAQPGFREEDFIKDPLKANLRAIKSEYEKARKIASDGIIGFNLMVAMEHYEEYVHAVVEAGADLIVSGAGLPTDLPKYVGESDILLAPIVSTAKSANVILKYWDKNRCWGRRLCKMPNFLRKRNHSHHAGHSYIFGKIWKKDSCCDGGRNS